MIAIKGILSALVILGINVLAKNKPALGGWIAALPIISLLSILWMSVDHKSNSDMIKFLEGVLWGLIPTAIMLLGVMISLRYGLKLPVAILLGISGWIVYTILARKIFI